MSTAQAGGQPATVHTRHCSDAKCARTYQVDPGEAKFQCPRCERWVGYCMGAADDMPALCDDCFCVIDAATARTPPQGEPRR